MLAKDFQKNAKEMEKIQRNQNWWAFSKPCIITFAVAGGVGFILFLIIWKAI